MLYMARCILEMQTPLHCGMRADDRNEAAVSRDTFGFWCIHGSSVAGILRRWVREQKGERYETALFGQMERAATPSLVWVSDAVLLDYDMTPAWQKAMAGKTTQITPGTFSRDRVGMDMTTGTVSRGQMFHVEYVPAGTRFACEIKLMNWEGDVDPDVLSVFSEMIQALEAGELRFGGFAGCGYGSYSVLECQCRSLDPTDPKQMEQWLNLDDAPLFPKKLGSVWKPGGSTERVRKDRISGRVTIPLRTSAPVLIAGGMPAEGMDADLCFATTACYDYAGRTVREQLVLPGSSLRGAVRHRVYTILETLGVRDPIAELNDLFGGTGTHVQRGRLAFFDATLASGQKALDPGAVTIVQHVGIDRLTGETLDSCLFNEAPLWQKDVSLSLSVHVHEITPWQAGILLHALLDLAQGTLSVGNGRGRGNGRMVLDRTRPFSCSLTWNGQELRAEDTATARKWLAGIAEACKEKGYAAAV